VIFVASDIFALLLNVLAASPLLLSLCVRVVLLGDNGVTCDETVFSDMTEEVKGLCDCVCVAMFICAILCYQ